MFIVEYQLPKMGNTKSGEQQRMRMSKMQKSWTIIKRRRKIKQNKNKTNGNNKRKNRKMGRR